MTSNMGSDLIREGYEKMKPGEEEETIERAKAAVFALLKGMVRPEFLNRIDEVIMFRPLDRSDIAAIVKIQLKELDQILAKQEITVEYTPEFLDWLAYEGYQPEFGARPLKRVITKKYFML